MALKGEGDARWVVRERADGRNVGKWHWEDKNVTGWAHSRIRELLSISDLEVPAKNHTGVKVEKLDSVEGDAMLYNRKGVLKVLYDLKVVGKWHSCHESEDDRTRGTFRFELFDDEPEVVVMMDAKSKCESVYKNEISKILQPRIDTMAKTFIAELRSGAGQQLDGVALPEKKKKPTETKVTDFLRSGMENDFTPTSTNKPKPKPTTTTLDLRDKFNCSPTDLYRCLTERPQLEAITRARCTSKPEVGEHFELMAGRVNGEYEKLESGKLIEMKWKMTSWGGDKNESRAHAKVSIEPDDNLVALRVQLKNVPTQFKTETEGFWRVQIFQSIKIVMGYGSGGAGFF